ncbi:MAG: serine/threonine protein kinase, partial [Deltaproteobacteria bacterium]|nr:serine/threonine protein kinase [Deltaproteobacteria bacterium]
MEYVQRKEIGSFVFHAHLDTGGTANVFLARKKGEESFAVIKILRKKWKNVPELTSMFDQEGQIMTRLKHPNVVQIIDQGKHEGLPYLVMEYLPGEHLNIVSKLAHKQKITISPSILAKIFLQVARGLEYVHEACDEQARKLELVHRDISPQNIFLCFDGTVKLLDFGIALVINSEVVTRTGVLKGKFSYMSPEQITHVDLDGRSDLFSLGVVMWEIICGRRLFKASNEFETMKMVVEKEIPSPGWYYDNLPKQLEEVVMQCLNRSIESRFSSAGQLCQALEQYLESCGPGDSLRFFTRQVLSDRHEQKKKIVNSIQREDSLREFLFGDMGDYLDGINVSDDIAKSFQDPVVSGAAIEPGTQSSLSSSDIQPIADELENTDGSIPAFSDVDPGYRETVIRKVEAKPHKNAVLEETPGKAPDPVEKSPVEKKKKIDQDNREYSQKILTKAKRQRKRKKISHRIVKYFMILIVLAGLGFGGWKLYGYLSVKFFSESNLPKQPGILSSQQPCP